MSNARWIYISPHLDDAILSCGGLIQKQTDSRTNVEVWTICAGDPPEGELSPFARKQQGRYQSDNDYYQERRREDIRACQLVGARHRHLPFQDCIYRRSTDGTWLYDSETAIFGVLSSDDTPTIKTITEFLETILKPSDIVVSPLALGNHVDNQLVRKAMDELDRPIRFYADIPYAIRQKEKFLKICNKLTYENYELSSNNISSWQKAIQAYNSQINVLFGDADQMSDSIVEYSKIFDEFRLWMRISLS